MNLDVMHFAKLCKIKIDNELAKKTEKSILKTLKSLENLPNYDGNENILNKNNIMTLRNDYVREDEFTRDDILKNAPKVKAGCFVVPKEID